MHRSRRGKTASRPSLRLEPLETRTLFHAGLFAFANGVIDIVPDHGNNTILVQWEPASSSVGVFLNGQEQLRVSGSQVRALNLRGLLGNDIAYLDARLSLLVSYDRGGGLGVLSNQLNGSGNDLDYYVATPGCQEFAFFCPSGEHAKPTADSVHAADTDVAGAIVAAHAAHGMMTSDGSIVPYGDSGRALPGDMGSALMSHRLYSESPYLHEAWASSDSMVTKDYAIKMGAQPKWMPPG
jgi:hypothetical protein